MEMCLHHQMKLKITYFLTRADLMKTNCENQISFVVIVLLLIYLKQRMMLMKKYDKLCERPKKAHITRRSRREKNVFKRVSCDTKRFFFFFAYSEWRATTTTTAAVTLCTVSILIFNVKLFKNSIDNNKHYFIFEMLVWIELKERRLLSCLIHNHTAKKNMNI